mgnify:CR=1 FL=1
MKRKTVLPLLLIIFMVSVITLAICGLRYDGSPRSGGDGRTITDMDDNNIEVPEDPRRIACMHGVSSERIIILGGAGALCFP